MTVQKHRLQGSQPLAAPRFDAAQGHGVDAAHLARPYRNFFKRLLDLTAVILTAPVILPLIGLLAFLVALDGGRPFYAQKRAGLNGKRYTMWKLRTMVVDADRKLHAYLESDPVAKAEWQLHQKLMHDPRITRTGRFLRRSSLDELPQLWNVFRGEMSLVGPRPMMISQTSKYPGTAYYRLRPGITGNWQVSERHESSFADRAKYDATYDRDLSFGTDLRILFKTVGVVLGAKGR